LLIGEDWEKRAVVIQDLAEIVDSVAANKDQLEQVLKLV
jgi:hypothetical protein